MSITEQELQRRLDASRVINQRERELKAEREQQRREQQQAQQQAQKEAAEAVEAREVAALKSEARQHWSGSAESFEAAWPALLQQIRNDKVIMAMRSRERHTLD